MGLQIEVQRNVLEQRERLRDGVNLYKKRNIFARNLIEIWGTSKGHEVRGLANCRSYGEGKREGGRIAGERRMETKMRVYRKSR